MRLKEVVVVLPYTGDRVLMQLRDFKPDIVFPGQWGFFGGSIEDGEDPNETAERELFEEIGYKPEIINVLEKETTLESNKIVIHSFLCALTVPIEVLVLREGLDFGIFPFDEVLSKKLYSRRLKRYFPVIPTKFVENMIKKLQKSLEKGNLLYTNK